MKRHFELVPYGNGRYGWRFVATEGRRPRVLAQSARTYRSPGRAKRAIERLQKADPTIEPAVEALPLPAAHFELLARALPLPVRDPHREGGSRKVTGYGAPVPVTAAPNPAAPKQQRQSVTVKKAAPQSAAAKSRKPPARTKKAK
jgi:hypothetical protein